MLNVSTCPAVVAESPTDREFHQENRSHRQRHDAFSSPDLSPSSAQLLAPPPTPALSRPHSFVEGEVPDFSAGSRSVSSRSNSSSAQQCASTSTCAIDSTATATGATSSSFYTDSVAERRAKTEEAEVEVEVETEAEKENRLCYKCGEHQAAWACRGCEWSVCNFCPDADGDEYCPLCNLRTSASNEPWFLYLPNAPRTRKTTCASTASAATATSNSTTSSGVSGCSAMTSVFATATSKRASRASSIGVGIGLAREHPTAVCRLCHMDLTSVDALGADHRENCITEELNGAPPADEYVRCAYCNMTLPKAYAEFHMAACPEVERVEPTADAERRTALGRQLARQAECASESGGGGAKDVEGARERLEAARAGPVWLVNAFADRLPYCGREVHEMPWRPLVWRALGLSWLCEPQGPLNGLPCLECQRKYLREKGAPEGSVLNADGAIARLARDGLFECNRLIDRVDGFANTCSWQNGHICDGCERISADPVFDYLRPLWAPAEVKLAEATPRHRFRASLEALDKKKSGKEEEEEKKKSDDTDSGRSSSSSTSSNQEATCTSSCRLCRAALTVTLTEAEARAHRQCCVVSRRPQLLEPEAWVRCMVCNLTIERPKARAHMLVCARVTPEQLLRRTRAQMGEMLARQGQPASADQDMDFDADEPDIYLPNWMTHHRQYCNQTVVHGSELHADEEDEGNGDEEEFEWEWVCEPQGDMNGMNCAACQRKLLADRSLPPGTIFNADGYPAHVARDGLFECARPLVPKSADATACDPADALTCSFDDHCICEACARASHEPAFTHLLPLLEPLSAH